ncbi:MAG: hypothetical protein HDR11_17000 [Lachnospiraceae bacterium]|nr:hypothetical protein [Lachnospiraceae bacterium]
MAINGNLPDYAVRKQNYSSYATQSIAESSTANSTKKKETEKTTETAGSSKAKKATDYANELAKLVPSVEFRVGNACVSDKSGKSLTVNPKLLEKMQNDPEKEKDMKDMIKGVESMSKMAESIAKATGWTIVYQHSYIDENGKYHCRMQTRNDGMLNLSDKLREERKKNSEKLLEKTKEKAQEESAYNKAEQLLEDKMIASKDGTIYLNDTDIKTIIEAAQEEDAGKTTVKEQAQVGANLDLKI